MTSRSEDPGRGSPQSRGPERDVDELIALSLSDEEREVLARGLSEWGGPARCTHELAIAMGFGSVEDLLAESERMCGHLEQGEPLTRSDWWRALLATEIAFVSDVVGSGVEWPTTTGLDDDQTIRILRAVQVTISRDVGR